ncbi:MAG TPA: translation elongation factor Ts [Acetobacteraceae bacterium]|jgi:elongation factor Ts|nr:translation elongation factor Ts [Acetobacteraceae bacterium]
MPEITAALVKDLRDKTGAGMMDCKRALTETAGDTEAAVDWLRKKGLAAAAKKSGRVAAEGLVGVVSANRRAAMVEVNAETDFVARNETFQGFVEAVAKIALDVGEDLDAIKAAPFPGTGRTVADELTQLVATIGENMNLRRARVLKVGSGVVATYVHNTLKPGLGKIGVLVAMEGTGEMSVLETLGRQVGMHIAASTPEALDIDGVDPAALAREKSVLVDQARASGRPDNIIEKMVEGRIRKFYEEVVLLEQVWVHDGESRVKAVLAKAGVKLVGFARFKLGEGIDKPQGPDFASEVAATAGV